MIQSSKPKDQIFIRKLIKDLNTEPNASVSKRDQYGQVNASEIPDQSLDATKIHSKQVILGDVSMVNFKAKKTQKKSSKKELLKSKDGKSKVTKIKKLKVSDFMSYSS